MRLACAIALVLVLAACRSQPARWGYIDRTGKVKIAPQFQRAEEFSEGLAPVVVNGRWGFIDVSGSLVIPARFGWAHGFSDGVAMVTTAAPNDYWSDDTKFGYIDHTGRFVIPEKFNWARPFSEGLAEACLGKCRNVPAGEARSVGYIDLKGEYVIPPGPTYTGRFSEGLAAVRTGTRGYDVPRWGYMDRGGKVVFDTDYHLAHPFSHGLAATNAGYIDKKGVLVIPAPQSSSVEGFSDGLGLVSGVYYDVKGNVVLRAVDSESFHEGLAVAHEGWGNSRWGFIDKKGQKAIPFQWGHARRFSEGLAAICVGCVDDTLF
jgi:hypothetical protein